MIWKIGPFLNWSITYPSGIDEYKTLDNHCITQLNPTH
jgi:hypothetical protein